MKKRNLIATNCPPGVDCDGKSVDDGEPGKFSILKNAFDSVDSQSSEYDQNRCQNLIVWVKVWWKMVIVYES